MHVGSARSLFHLFPPRIVSRWYDELLSFLTYIHTDTFIHTSQPSFVYSRFLPFLINLYRANRCFTLYPHAQIRRLSQQLTRHRIPHRCTRSGYFSYRYLSLHPYPRCHRCPRKNYRTFLYNTPGSAASALLQSTRGQ
jgi:hypothetical protein